MNQGIVGPRKTVFFLLFISMLVLRSDFALADEWKDADFTEEHEGGNGAWTWTWEGLGFSASEAKTWKLAGYGYEAGELKDFLFSNPDEVKQFTAKYCKKGFARGGAFGAIVPPPVNPNDADGFHCYEFEGKVFQLLGDYEALYKFQFLGDKVILYHLAGTDGLETNGMYYISFGKGGRAVSSIKAIVTVKGSYKYQSMAGIKIVPELKILKTTEK